MAHLKKIYSTLTLGIIVAIVALTPGIIFAQGGLVPCGDTPEHPCTYADLVSGPKGLLSTIINFLAKDLAIPLVVLMFVWGGIIMVTEADKPSGRTKGWAIIKTAMWGLVITLAAYLIVKVIVLGLGGDASAYNFNSIFQ